MAAPQVFKTDKTGLKTITLTLTEAEVACIRDILGNNPSDYWSQIGRTSLRILAFGHDIPDAASFAEKCLLLGIGDSDNDNG